MIWQILDAHHGLHITAMLFYTVVIIVSYYVQSGLSIIFPCKGNASVKVEEVRVIVIYKIFHTRCPMFAPTLWRIKGVAQISISMRV